MGSVDSDEQEIQKREDREDVKHIIKWVKFQNTVVCGAELGQLVEGDCYFLLTCFQKDRHLHVTTDKVMVEGENEGLETREEQGEEAATTCCISDCAEIWERGG